MNYAVKQKIENHIIEGWLNKNSLRIYFVNKYPPSVFKIKDKEHVTNLFEFSDSNDEFYNFQKNLMEIFYGLKYGFTGTDFKENDILKKDDVADYLINRDNYDEDGKEACIVFECVYKILNLEHNITPDNPQKIIEEINEIKQNNSSLETIYDIQIEYISRHISHKTLKNLYELKKKEEDFKKIEYLKNRNIKLEEEKSKLEEEKRCFIIANKKLKMVSKWLDDNSDNINFKIGKELYDILNQ